MKTRFFQILGVVAIATVGITSCETDACKDVDCGLNGTCVDGDCVCDAGYEGVDCDTEERAKFLGTYNVSESCTSGNYTYSVTVSTSSSSVASIIISNFGDYGVNVTGTVSGSAVTIASQSVGGGQFQGSGQISGNIMTITYTVTAGTSTDSCTMTCTKQ
jgi:hypothetical protein